MDEEYIGKAVVHCALNLHKELGPGLLESVYEIVMFKELENLGFKVKRQVIQFPTFFP